jgi:hypothetical protein
MATKKPKTVAGVRIESKKRKHGAPRNAFKKGNTLGFQPGAGSPNPGGKPHHADALLSRSLRVILADHAPDDVCKAMGLPTHASWSQCIARKLIYMAVRGDLQAIGEIRSLTESAHVALDLDFPGGMMIPVPPIVFLQSDGNGRLSPADLKMVEADARPAPLELPAEV